MAKALFLVLKKLRTFFAVQLLTLHRKINQSTYRRVEIQAYGNSDSHRLQKAPDIMIRWLFEVSNTQVWQCSSRDWGRSCAHLWWGGGWYLVLVESGHVFISCLWVTGYIQDGESVKETWKKFRQILNLPRPSHSLCVPRINDFQKSKIYLANMAKGSKQILLVRKWRNTSWLWS